MADISNQVYHSYSRESQDIGLQCYSLKFNCVPTIN